MPFYFESKENKYLICRNIPYFFGTQGMYLNWWTPDLNHERDVPSTVHVWVHLSHIPLNYWNEDTMHSIGDTLGCYIDKLEPKDDMFACEESAWRFILKKSSCKQSLLPWIIGNMYILWTTNN
jgi:hypothetical protein